MAKKVIGKWIRAGAKLTTKGGGKEFIAGVEGKDMIERGKDLPAKSFDAHVAKKNIALVTEPPKEADVPDDAEG